ncbi:HGGxSTG domain-containing protein [Bradyrhizobium sp. AZCC 2230]|uniref:HGGxSTG domain-containing protein n=1 Tax=Bradyrhizobium sp. AZCC 2230 TaxID=3117021 RepID=UPI002FF0E867
MRRAKRCGAKTRSGKPCQSPAMANGRCRMHGGPSPGAPKGNRHAYKHGRYTAESIGHRRRLSALLLAMKALAGMAHD